VLRDLGAGRNTHFLKFQSMHVSPDRFRLALHL
jgi:hypothetical protein